MPLTHKWCSRGDHMVPFADFHRNKNRADGLAQWCKVCAKAYSKEWGSRPEVKKRTAANALARYHALSADEKLRIQERRYGQGRNLLKYGLTLEDYERMLDAQAGVCAICERPPKKNRLAVDHDHACCPGEGSCGSCVRGLLCITCNVWLGFYENREWVAGADRYLDREIANREARA